MPWRPDGDVRHCMRLTLKVRRPTTVPHHAVVDEAAQPAVLSARAKATLPGTLSETPFSLGPLDPSFSRDLDLAAGSIILVGIFVFSVSPHPVLWA